MDKINIPLSLLLAILVPGLGLSGAAAVAQFRISDHETRIEAVEKKEEKSAAQGIEQDVMLRTISETLKEIKQDVKDLKKQER